jgi:hypothetical protein
MQHTKQFSPLQVKTALSIWQGGVKSTKRLVGLLVRAVPLIVGGQCLGWVKACFVFARFVTRMKRQNGDRGLALYLKTCNVSLMRYLGEEKRVQPRLIGSAVSQTRSGIPRMIPGNHRLRIKQGDRGVIRLWLGFCTLYRVLNFKGKMSFKTVTAPGVVIPDKFLVEWDVHCGRFTKLLSEFGVSPLRKVVVPSTRSRGDIRDFGVVANHDDPNIWCPPGGVLKNEILGYVISCVALMTSGPNSSRERLDKSKPQDPKSNPVMSRVSVGNLIDDCAAWVTRPKLFQSLVTILILVRASSLLFAPIWDAATVLLKEHFKGDVGILSWKNGKQRGQFGKLGKLALVEEPGKMRVVAMVDCLTQWVLYPLHRYIFDSILKVIPQDGLFDQQAPVVALIRKLRALGRSECFSYDLSAATDRIPVVIQEKLLGFFLSPEFASHWRILLTERAYFLPNLWVKTYGKGIRSVRYAVGQPMGAYSSWAMLALVHHAIVQLAASRAGVCGWFELYAVLGDDIVIGDRGVALEYTRIMDTLGVGIGFNKSITSKNLSLEFAKRFYFRGEEVTPLPLVAIACGWLGVTGVPETVKASSGRLGGWPSMYSVLRSMGLGFKVASRSATSRLGDLSRKARSIVLLLTRPAIASPWAARNVWDWYRQDKLCRSRPPHASWAQPVISLIRSRIESVDLVRIRKSLWNAFRGFHLDLKYSEVDGLARWFEDEVAGAYRAPMVASIAEFDDIRSRVIESSPMDTLGMAEELFILSMFNALDTIETLAARLPSKVSVFRSLAATMGRDRKRVPKTLRLWHKVDKVLRRPTPPVPEAPVASSVVVEGSDWRNSRTDSEIIMDLHQQLMSTEGSG